MNHLAASVPLLSTRCLFQLLLCFCVLASLVKTVRADSVSNRQTEFLESFYQDYDNSGALGVSAGPTFNWSYAAISLNKGQAKIDQANAAIQSYLTNNQDQWVNPQGGFATIDSYWHLPMLARLVTDPDLLGSVTPANQNLLKEFLWSFSQNTEPADMNSLAQGVAHRIVDSDNHDLHRRAVYWSTAQALKDDPNFQNRQYSTGEVPQQRYTQWGNQLLAYFQDRAGRGGSVEVASPTYQGRYLQSVFAIGDLAQDSRLADQARKYTDLIFADIALESINGMRGGAKVRAYKNRIGYAVHDRSTHYNYLFMGEPAAGLSLLPDGLHLLETFGPTTSDYRIPSYLLEFASDESGRGVFDYVTNRMAQGTRTVENGTLIYHPQEPSAFLRTSRVTPEHVLGWFTIDETKTYMQIHTQNQWMGAITDAEPDSRIGVFVTPTSSDLRTGYQELQGVGSGQAMLARRQLAAGSSTQMRIYISEDFTYAEESDWIFGTNGNGSTYFALRGVLPSGTPTYSSESVASGFAPGGEWLTFDDQDTNVILQTGRAVEYASLEAFKQDVLNNAVQWLNGNTLEYDAGFNNGVLTLFPDNRIPLVDGQTLDLTPTNVYESPYLNASTGNTAVTITDLMENEHTIDFEYMPVAPTFDGAWTLLGDRDDFSYAGPGSDDDPLVLSAWEQQFATTLGHLDEAGNNKTRLASFVAPIDEDLVLTNARLVVRVRATGSGSDNDVLILDDMANAIPLADLTVVETTLDAQVLSFDFGALDLAMLSDGILNIAISDDHEVDWMMLTWADLVGDFNGDGNVNLADVPLFVQALVDRAAFDTAFPALDADLIGDVNQDGTFDLGDIGLFSGLFNGPTPASAQAIPEPTTLSLAVVLLLGIAIRRRRRV